MENDVHIAAAARALGVTSQHIGVLEWQGRIPPARRDFNSRVYSEFDIALLKSLGVGTRPRRLKQPHEVVSG